MISQYLELKSVIRCHPIQELSEMLVNPRLSPCIKGKLAGSGSQAAAGWVFEPAGAACPPYAQLSPRNPLGDLHPCPVARGPSPGPAQCHPFGDPALLGA